MPCPPLLVAPPPWRPCAALSRKLSRALRLRETATLALASLAESTLELPSSRPHLLARVLRADDGPDDGDGDGDGDGATGEVSPRESSVNVSFAGSYFGLFVNVSQFWKFRCKLVLSANSNGSENEQRSTHNIDIFVNYSIKYRKISARRHLQ